LAAVFPGKVDQDGLPNKEEQFSLRLKFCQKRWMLAVGITERVSMKRVLLQWLTFGVATLCANQVIAGEKKHTDSKLHVVLDDAGQIVLSWNGKEELAEARG